MKLSVLLLIVLLLVSASAMAFDGQRKGFVLGGGLGFSPSSKIELSSSPHESTYDFSISKAGVGLNILIGYAWDEKNMLVYEGNVTAYDPGDSGSDVVYAQGFDGISWYHYYGDAGKTFFTTVGLGTYQFQDSEDTSFDMGFGILLGGGYEFSRHWQVGGYLGIGSTTYLDSDYDHVHFSVLVSVVAF